MSPSSDLAAQYVQVEVASPEDQQFIVYTEWNRLLKNNSQQEEKKWLDKQWSLTYVESFLEKNPKL